ncbi:hypothetical protein B6N60_00130 [Richelia sinica FACHB-800]|uniref:LTD domain-containing protein n=1 Tax=Richelia sinica FACHB-800 TaxID=1357546 RepID=A0A975T3B4_9NOST|nr:lamin tail domain-containing protein [Richelia sinica]QXE21456.1 hypothetical protein B6N60_00130 [Richelia sinica FACHB-800]
MSPVLKKNLLAANHNPVNNYKKFLSSLALSMCCLSYWTQIAHAEGSRSLYPSAATGSRANIEWRNSKYGNLIFRRTLLKVFAKQGEYILTGSSAVDVGSGDILIFNPGRVTGSVGEETIPSTADFRCSPVTTTNAGKITSRALELAGPRSVDGTGNTSGYIPCAYQAPSTGIYDVVFYGPDGNNVDTQGTIAADIALSNSINFDTTQRTSVAAWDVTVRSSDISSTTDITGRLFSYYLALFTGANGRPLNFPVYPVTTDGFRYRITLRGTDPNGFALYGNQVGFFDSDGVTPLYHNVLGTDAQLTTPQGGVKLSRPQYPTFFNLLDDQALAYIDRYNPNGTLDGTGIPVLPGIPTITNVGFTGTAAANNSNFGTGGTFNFDSNVEGYYTIIISRDGVNFDPTKAENRIIRGNITTPGSQTVPWDGKDNNGSFFPVGTGYKFVVRTQAGEYHFPLLDAENNFSGGPTIEMLNATNPLGNRTAFYDDRGYKTIGGTTIGTIGSVLCGINPPNPAFSDPLNGFDSSLNNRKFGQSGDNGNANTSCNGSFGDVKGLDIWTYYTPVLAPTDFNIVDAVSANAGKVIINEVLYKEVVGSPAASNPEFIELYNASSVAVNLTGFILSDGHLTASDNDGANGFTYTFPNGTTLQPGKYAVIWLGNNTPNNQATNAAFQDWLGNNPKLNNTGDDIWLYDNQNKVIDYIAYGTGGEINQTPASVLNLWNDVNQSNLANASVNQSISLTPNGQDSNSSSCWEPTTSTVPLTNCSNDLQTRDTDTVTGRITSVGENNNGSNPPNLVLVKRITRINNSDITQIVDGRSDVPTTDNNYVIPARADEDNDPKWPANYLRGLINAGTVKPGDILEYTIYFLSNGLGNATKVKFCDLVPNNVTFLPTAFNGLTPKDGGLPTAEQGIALAIGSITPSFYLTNAADNDRGRLYIPNDPATPALCGSNTNGAVVVDITRDPDTPSLPAATGSGTPSSSYGFIRFRGTVK